MMQHHGKPEAAGHGQPATGEGGDTPERRVPLVAVVGPTGSGKSALAVAVAEAVGGEVINTDALQVYRHFDIGTAKPKPVERERVPHHLLDVVEPDAGYSAGQYVADARAVIARLATGGRVPVLCGGTGLYFRALLDGLADIPRVSPEVQAAAEREVAEQGAPAGHAALAAVDSEAAARIHPNDPMRVARALAVHRATGQPLSAYQQAHPFEGTPPNVLMLGPAWPRAALYERINARVAAMFAAGWVAEVRGLLARGYGPSLPPFKAIGYREIAAWLGEHDGEDNARDGAAAEALGPGIAQRTRRYAKRQLTWFRHQASVRWVEPGAPDEAVAAAEAFLKTS